MTIDWTDDLVTNLTALWNEGMPSRAIGKKIGVSSYSVCKKAKELNLTARPDPMAHMKAANGRVKKPQKIDQAFFYFATRKHAPRISSPAELEHDVLKRIAPKLLRTLLPDTERFHRPVSDKEISSLQKFLVRIYQASLKDDPREHTKFPYNPHAIIINLNHQLDVDHANMGLDGEAPQLCTDHIRFPVVDLRLLHLSGPKAEMAD